MTTVAAVRTPPAPWARSGTAAHASRARRRIRVTFLGLLFMFVNGLVLLAGLNSEANLLLLLFGIGIGALTVNGVLPFLMLRRLDVERIMPEGVVADRPFAVVYRVCNRSRRLRAWALTVTEAPISEPWTRFPEVFIDCLPPRQEQRAEVVGRCPRRAHLSLTGVRVTSGFPFGLFNVTAEFAAADELIVYPAIGRLRHDPWKTTCVGQAQSARPSQERENPEEFVGVREYREGDNYRWIHWRRSAHTGELVVREMIPLRQTRLIVMLDPWPVGLNDPPLKGSNPPDNTEAEQVICAAATIICAGLEQGHRVGLICRAAELAVIPPGTGKAHRQRLLRELACIEPGARTAFDELVGRVHWSMGWNVRCVVLGAKLQPEHTRVARAAGARAEAVLAMSPGSGTFEALFDLSGQGTAGRRAR
jgi:uncharacterized protein (DUF58 family)